MPRWQDFEGRSWAAFAVALKAGLVYWLLVSLAMGGGEPWDAPGYFSVAYPGALLLAALVGGVFPTRAWLWGAVIVLAQVPVVVLMAGGAGSLLLAGLLYALLLALPAVAASALGGALSRRLRASR